MTILKQAADNSLTEHYIVVPITREIHIHPHDASAVIVDPDVEIVDHAFLDNRAEVTLVTMVGTTKGKMQALIRISREEFVQHDLAARTRAGFSPDWDQLLFHHPEAQTDEAIIIAEGQDGAGANPLPARRRAPL